ncbi:MAG: phenylacetate-CoA oxygenase subunit PaaJ [Chloroflexi bacterium]|nr:phenylacetate-CoA oxygenase subunit PaaJ [Chloroflexota bacterium]
MTTGAEPAGGGTAAFDEAAVRAALRAVTDPEIPTVSIVDLGMVEHVEVAPHRIEVELLPTFVGCPAQDVIRAAVASALEPFGRSTTVGFSFRVPWTSDRITAVGRERLEASGFAPPAEPGRVRCPYCRSGRVAMDSAFGPTQCRSLFYCRDCRQPFEAFKPV